MNWLLRVARRLIEFDPFREQADARRREEERAELARRVAMSRAARLYKAAMSQASQAKREDSARLAQMALESFRAANTEMLRVGLRPEEHPRRAMALSRLLETGAAEYDG